MQPKVSIVVAVYNEEKHLDKCVNSVLAQTEKDLELILVNDGSKDRSEEIIDKFIADNPDRKIVKINKPNGGLSSARNIAFDQLTGEYITFLDADDYYEEHYLENVLKVAKKYDCDVVCSGQHKITEDGKILNTIKYEIDSENNSLQRRLNISGKLYRTEYVRKWGFRFPEGKLYEDNSFNMQAFFLTDKIKFLDYEGYYQVVHEGSITSKPIDASRLPFDEWERVVKLIKSSNVPGVDMEMFDLTYISFFTYFLMVRNKKREYLSNASDNNCAVPAYHRRELQ